MVKVKIREIQLRVNQPDKTQGRLGSYDTKLFTFVQGSVHLYFSLKFKILFSCSLFEITALGYRIKQDFNT